MTHPFDEIRKAVGPCPVCGQEFSCFNDVPLRAFCGGRDTPHAVCSVLVPQEHNPYPIPEVEHFSIEVKVKVRVETLALHPRGLTLEEIFEDLVSGMSYNMTYSDEDGTMIVQTEIMGYEEI